MAVLYGSVLVLNQNYEPLHVCNVKRALVLVTRGKAEMIEDAGKLLRTVTAAFPVPSVIRMVYFIRRPRPTTRLSRREVFARDGYTCQYCRKRTQDLTLDHVMPRHRGGEHSWENLTSACRACNHRKAGRTPREANMKLLRAPKRPRATFVQIFGRYLDRNPAWGFFIPGAEKLRERVSAAAGR